MFIKAPHTEPTTSTVVATKIERPSQNNIGDERGPTTTSSTITEAVSTQP